MIAALDSDLQTIGGAMALLFMSLKAKEGTNLLSPVSLNTAIITFGKQSKVGLCRVKKIINVKHMHGWRHRL